MIQVRIQATINASKVSFPTFLGAVIGEPDITSACPSTPVCTVQRGALTHNFMQNSVQVWSTQDCTLI